MYLCQPIVPAICANLSDMHLQAVERLLDEGDKWSDEGRVDDVSPASFHVVELLRHVVQLPHICTCSASLTLQLSRQLGSPRQPAPCMRGPMAGTLRALAYEQCATSISILHCVMLSYGLLILAGGPDPEVQHVSTGPAAQGACGSEVEEQPVVLSGIAARFIRLAQCVGPLLAAGQAMSGVAAAERAFKAAAQGGKSRKGEQAASMRRKQTEVLEQFLMVAELLPVRLDQLVAVVKQRQSGRARLLAALVRALRQAPAVSSSLRGSLARVTSYLVGPVAIVAYRQIAQEAAEGVQGEDVLGQVTRGAAFQELWGWSQKACSELMAELSTCPGLGHLGEADLGWSSQPVQDPLQELLQPGREHIVLGEML